MLALEKSLCRDYFYVLDYFSCNKLIFESWNHFYIIISFQRQKQSPNASCYILSHFIIFVIFHHFCSISSFFVTYYHFLLHFITFCFILLIFIILSSFFILFYIIIIIFTSLCIQFIIFIRFHYIIKTLRNKEPAIIILFISRAPIRVPKGPFFRIGKPFSTPILTSMPNRQGNGLKKAQKSAKNEGFFTKLKTG